MRILRFIGWAVVWLIAFFCVLWAIGALSYDFPGHGSWAAIVFVVILVAALIFVRGKAWKLGAVFLGFVIVLCWWRTLKPTNDRDWTPDVAETAWAEIDGDRVTIHNVRNCDYRTEHDFDTRWETRTVQLSQLQGIDLIIMYWGSPYMAHPIASFRFADQLPLCFSIETRKAVGQEYSAVRGLYRQYTLIYIAADERDSVRVRTNYRHGEDVYLYRTMATPEKARAGFVEYINTLNALHIHPRWYNAVTDNCTTSIREQRTASERIPWDWRILVNGKGDEMLYERHLIVTDGLSFNELKQRSLINKRAQAADQDPEFSKRIRENTPGFASN